MTKPVFVFSLPRAGSTLLQRILSAHDEIATTAEPWILLPLFYATRSEGLIAEYSQKNAAIGISGFLADAGVTESDLRRRIAAMVSTLYSSAAANGQRYFVDKTPRYYLIIDEIVDAFPDAKFIFLFRNPVHSAASMIQTWGNGRLHRVAAHTIDIETGFGALSRAYRLYKEKAIAVRYEDMVRDGEQEFRRIFSYLDLEFDPATLRDLGRLQVEGRLGDRTGVEEYTTLSAHGSEVWRSVFSGAVRRRWVLRCLRKVPAQAFADQGYSKEDIVAEIERLPVRFSPLRNALDLFDLAISTVVRTLKLHLYLGRDWRWTRGRFLS